MICGGETGSFLDRRQLFICALRRLQRTPPNIEFCHRYQKSCQTSSKVLRDCYEASNQSVDRPRCARHRDHGRDLDRPSLSLPRGDVHRSAYGDDRHANHVNRASGLQFQMCSSKRENKL